MTKNHVPAAEVMTFMEARARRARRLIRNGGELKCEKYHVEISCTNDATHVCVEGLRCPDHLEGTNYGTRI